MNEFNGVAANRLDYTIHKYVNAIESNTIYNTDKTTQNEV